MQFQNLKISSKILSSILVIAVIVLSGSLYVRSQIRQIDSNYQALINGEEIAVLETSITLRLLVQYSTAIYTLTLEDSEEGNRRSSAEVKDLANRLLAREEMVRQYIPDRAEKVHEAFSGIPNAIAVCTPLAQQAATVTAAADILPFALRMKTQCEPVIHAALTKARDYALALNEEMKAESRQLSAESASVTLVTLWLNVAGLVFGSAIALGICRFGVTKPLARLGAVMSELAGGRLDVLVPSQDRKDEVGDMARTVLVFQNNAREVEAMRAERERQKELAEQAQRQAMIQLADSFEARVMGVVQLVAESAAEMEKTARNVATGAQESSQQSITVAAAAQQSTSNVETVATAAEELSASIAEISRQVADAATMSSTAAEETTAANRMVAALDASAARIGEVVKLINDIASQTNLLALNATIEAARAGEAGKGFAVVAGEVKHLANQTAKATEEIAGQIGTVQAETQRTVDAIKSIGNTVEMVRQTSAAIASAVEEQGAATREIARNVEQAAQGTHDVSANVVLITRNADSAVAESGNILNAAQELAANAAKLRAEVSGFLSDVRAG